MAQLNHPTALAPLPGAVQGRTPQRYTTPALVPLPGAVQRDYRHLRPTAGTVADQVVLKTAAGEQPFANARVWLLRLADGRIAWEGWSNASGHYTATGLELGVDYVAVAIDPTRTHKTTAAGPITAT